MSLILSGSDGLSDVDGTAATPAIRGTDTNTGIFFPAADTIAFSEGGTEAMRIDSDGDVGIGTTSPANKLDVVGSTSTTKIRSLGTTGASYYFGENDGGNLSVGVDNNTGSAVCGTAYAQFVWGSGFLTPLIFGCNNTERMRIDSSGNLLVACTSAPSASVAGVALSNPTVSAPRISTGSGTGVSTALGFTNGNGNVGAINTSGSNTSYATSSDYRLKEDIAPMTGALNKVALLKPCTYKWKIDGAEGEGFIAHELAEVAPQAVIGEKDALDNEGNPAYQSIDTSFLVATLTAAIQELKATVDAQAARIAALESAGA
jgi:hypothetical protein